MRGLAAAQPLACSALCVAETRASRALRPYCAPQVEEGVEGERVRIEVGAVGERAPRTFVFSKVGCCCRMPMLLITMSHASCAWLCARPAG